MMACPVFVDPRHDDTNDEPVEQAAPWIVAAVSWQMASVQQIFPCYYNKSYINRSWLQHGFIFRL